MKSILAAATALFSLSMLAAPANAEALKTGFLVCQVEEGSGFVFGSTKTVACTFTPSKSSKEPERYTGVISRYGVDLGFTSNALLKWAVLAVHDEAYSRGALTGRYVGAGAEATAAIGVGANVLVSSTRENWVLQPVSVSDQTGLNIAFGIADFELVSASK